MEGLKRELKMLEIVELQILGALHKIKGARCNEGETDIETVAIVSMIESAGEDLELQDQTPKQNN